jgi:hypothetical protein
MRLTSRRHDLLLPEVGSNLIQTHAVVTTVVLQLATPYLGNSEESFVALRMTAESIHDV